MRVILLQIALLRQFLIRRLAKRLRCDEGEEDLLSVLAIQQRVIGARSSLSTVERLLLEQRINLNLALGGSWDD
jgi:outer membrane protein TolC